MSVFLSMLNMAALLTALIPTTFVRAILTYLCHQILSVIAVIVVIVVVGLPIALIISLSE